MGSCRVSSSRLCDSRRCHCLRGVLFNWATVDNDLAATGGEASRAPPFSFRVFRLDTFIYLVGCLNGDGVLRQIMSCYVGEWSYKDTDEFYFCSFIFTSAGLTAETRQVSDARES